MAGATSFPSPWPFSNVGRDVILFCATIRSTPGAPARLEYTQLTNFADSATSPALSPDGRMLAFVRGESTVSGPGQIYVKLLPDGEPLQLTHNGPDITVSDPSSRSMGRASHTG